MIEYVKSQYYYKFLVWGGGPQIWGFPLSEVTFFVEKSEFGAAFTKKFKQY